jgi:hypothetical protein
MELRHSTRLFIQTPISLREITGHGEAAQHHQAVSLGIGFTCTGFRKQRIHARSQFL